MASAPSGDVRDHNAGNNPAAEYQAEDMIDLRELFMRLWRGLPQVIGFALLGLALAGAVTLLYSPFQSVSTTTRVAFSFPGFEKGEYPDKSKFQPDDIRTPDVVTEALKRRRLDTSPEFQSRIRAALSIEGIVPANIVRDRDRLRASGQTPPNYIPDEYTVSLLLPRKFPLSMDQRAQLLSEIISVYQQNFRRTYSDTPLAFGDAFASLRDADYPDYETVFDREIRNIVGYLTQQAQQAKLFRSVTTNLTFSDLLKQTQLFAQIRLNETLGLIHQNGLSRDRKMALVKMNDALRLLTDDERRALDEESVVRELLVQAQNREQNYVLGVKSQASQPRSESPVLDQSVIDSLLANDAYNFLVRRALDAGLQVKRVQADKTQLLEQIDNMKAFSKTSVGDQADVMNDTRKSIASLESAYTALIDSIRKTHIDFSRQQYGDAVRISDQIATLGGSLRTIAIACCIGGFLGFAFGSGLSLLGVYIAAKRSA